MKRFFISLIDLYRLMFSPILVGLFGHGCRYDPTCSQYAKGVIKKFGVIKGGQLAFRRIISCHPFSKKSYYDPVPTP